VLRIGLTGGIACGKSHVLRRLARAGGRTLDLDTVAHDVIAPGGPGYAEVVEAFGSGVVGPGGAIDRKALGEIVFRDATARSRLNAIVHPRVRAAERAWTERQAEGDVLVVDAALLVETGVHLRFDRLVVVHCAPDVQLRRLRERDGSSEAAARARIEAQMPLREKRRFAHYEVDTSGDFSGTEEATDRLAVELRALLPRPARVVLPEARAAGALVHGPRSGPRGLTPARLLAEIAESGGMELERVASGLRPRPSGPWYLAGEPAGSGPRAESLMAPLVLWALARAGADPPFLAAAAASLARLFHSDAADVADACLMALVLQEAALGGRVPRDVGEKGDGVSALAERWGGAAPTARVRALVKTAAELGGEPAEPGEAGALAGLARGAPVERLSPESRAALAKLR
jgi:dephospho-CoA kinase